MDIRKIIDEIKKDNLLNENAERVEEYLDSIYEQLTEFDVNTIKDEQHLRTLIMDRVLETAVKLLAVRVRTNESEEDDDDRNKGIIVRLLDMPEKMRMKHLNKLMLEILDHFEGPGPALRQSIARLILDYRLLPRLKETLATLYPSSAKHERVLKSIRHVESQIAMGMFSLYVWPMREDDKRKKEFQEIRAKLLGNALENPEAFMGKE
jgi:hypothetical protein